MPVRYIPILRWKRGERIGLRRVHGPSSPKVFPLFILGTDQFKPKAATKNKAAVQAPDVFVQEAANTWNNLPFALDASTLPIHGPQHALTGIAAGARANGIHLIPATNLGAPALYQVAVASAAQIDQRGVCLRIDLQEATSIANWIAQWPFPPNETDLVIDFGETVGQVAALGAALTTAMMNLHLGNQWRTVTIAGTSMPQNFGGFVSGVHLIPRTEFTLWQHLSAAGLPYALDYGDFGAVSPGVAPPNIAWGYPINVRYTLPNDFLICRGVRTDGPLGVDMDVQLVQHANSIVNQPGRNPLAHCWGDNTIDQIAVGAAPPQGLEHWVQLSVCRHVDLMAAILP